MKPLARWPGGQYKVAKKLVKVFPKHDTYVEPFAGGASLFWNKPPAELEVLGDMNGNLIRFYDKARRGGLEGCRPVIQSAKAFSKAKACKDDDPCCYLLFNRMAFDGSENETRSPSFDGKPVAQHILKEPEKWAGRLRKTHMRIADFADTMEKFDSPTTLHFLDPPWTTDAMPRQYAKKKYGKANAAISLEEVASTAARMQGKVILIHHDSPEAIRILQKHGFKLYRVKTMRGGKKEGNRHTTRIVAANFDVKKGKR